LLILHRLAWQFGVPSVPELARILTYPDFLNWVAFVKILNDEQERAMKA